MAAPAPAPPLSGSGHEVGESGMVWLRGRRWRATTGGRRGGGASGRRSAPLARGSGRGGAYPARMRASRRWIRCGSCTGDGGRGCDCRLRAGGEAAVDPAAAPSPRARCDVYHSKLGLQWIWRSSGGHLHAALLSMSGASTNKNLTYTYRLYMLSKNFVFISS